MYNNANCVLELTHIQSELARDIQTVYQVNIHNVTHRYTLYMGITKKRDNRVAQYRASWNQKLTSLQQGLQKYNCYWRLVGGVIESYSSSGKTLILFCGEWLLSTFKTQAVGTPLLGCNSVFFQFFIFGDILFHDKQQQTTSCPVASNKQKTKECLWKLKCKDVHSLMELMSPSWEAANFAATRELPSIL
jgi:hypothetical protein